MRWSKAREHGTSAINNERGDVLYQWGDDAVKSDGSLLHYHFGVREWDYVEKKSRPSLLEELHARGYDLTTLKFSIKKRK
jgi:hypothetical protein